MADILDVLTLAEAKAPLRITLTDVSKDVELASIVTLVSRQLDRCVGPVVKRTITNELHDGGGEGNGYGFFGPVWTRFMPVFSFTTVTEYRAGTPTVLTAESPGSLVDGYLAEPYEYNPALFSGEIMRRTNGRTRWFAAGSRNIALTYVAGRSADTASVDAKYKEAASILLRNLWHANEQSIAQVGEYAVPAQSFPKDGITAAVKDLLYDEWQLRPGHT